MTKTGWALAILTFCILVAAVILFILPSKTAAPTQNVAHIAGRVVVATPLIGESIGATSTMVTGTARGWYFEASFPVEIRNESGVIVAQAPAQAQGDWMVDAFVPFSVALAYPAQPTGSVGTIILRKDNPSGLPENDESLEVPIVFR